MEKDKEEEGVKESKRAREDGKEKKRQTER